MIDCVGYMNSEKIFASKAREPRRRLSLPSYGYTFPDFKRAQRNIKKRKEAIYGKSGISAN